MTVGEDSVQYRKREKKPPKNKQTKKTHCFLVAAILFYIGKFIIIKWPTWVV